MYIRNSLQAKFMNNTEVLFIIKYFPLKINVSKLLTKFFIPLPVLQ